MRRCWPCSASAGAATSAPGRAATPRGAGLALLALLLEEDEAALDGVREAAELGAAGDALRHPVVHLGRDGHAHADLVAVRGGAGARHCRTHGDGGLQRRVSGSAPKED